MTNQELIAQLYIGYFNRAPDPEGFTFWLKALEGGVSLQEIAQYFSEQPETEALYAYFTNPAAGDAEAFLTSVYQNLFDREPDADGLVFWTGVVESGRPVGQVILDIIEGAQGDDATLLANKMEVALFFEELSQIEDGFVFDGEALAASQVALDAVTPDPASVPEASLIVKGFFNDPPNVSLTPVVSSLSEGTTIGRIKVADIEITDDALGANTLSLTGGDAQVFEIDGLELFLKGRTERDFEGDSQLNVTVEVDDASIGETPDDAVSLDIPINDRNEGPVITTDVSGLTILENTTTVIDLDGDDPEGDELTYAISGGSDATLFKVDTETGELSFAAAPDFETPLDQGADNTYEVTVQVSDGTESDALNIAVEVLDVEPLTYTATSPVVPNELSFVGDGPTNDWSINIFTNGFGFSADADDLSLFRNYSIALSGGGTGSDQDFSLTLDGNDMQTAAEFDFSAIGGTSRVDSSFILNTAANSEPVTLLGLLLNEGVDYDIDTGTGNDGFELALGESLDYTGPANPLNINAGGGSDTLNLDLNGNDLLLDTTSFGDAVLDSVENLVVTGASASGFGGAVFRFDATTEFSQLDFSGMSSDEAEVHLGAATTLLPSADGLAIVTQATGNDMLIDVGLATGSGPLGDFTIDSQDDDDEIRIDADGNADHIVTILNYNSDEESGSDDIVLNAAGGTEAQNAVDVTAVGQAVLSETDQTGDAINMILNLTGLAASTVGGIGGGGDLSDTLDGGAVELAIAEALLNTGGAALAGGDDEYYVVLDNATDTAIYRMSVQSATGEVNSTANITDVTQIVRLVGVAEVNNTDFDLEYTL